MFFYRKKSNSNFYALPHSMEEFVIPRNKNCISRLSNSLKFPYEIKKVDKTRMCIKPAGHLI